MASGAQATVDRSETKELENALHIVIGGKGLLVRSSEIRQVVRPTSLTSAPMGPEHIIGLANIHGQIVCIIDIGGVTALPSCSRDQTSRTRFLLLRHPVMHVGIWADEVCSIRRLNKGLLAESASGDERVVQIDIDGTSYDLLECSRLLNETTNDCRLRGEE